jgi:hypothetical protein
MNLQLISIRLALCFFVYLLLQRTKKCTVCQADSKALKIAPTGKQSCSYDATMNRGSLLYAILFSLQQRDRGRMESDASYLAAFIIKTVLVGALLKRL